MQFLKASADVLYGSAMSYKNRMADTALNHCFADWCLKVLFREKE